MRIWFAARVRSSNPAETIVKLENPISSSTERIMMSVFTTEDQVDVLVSALQEAVPA